MYADGAGVPQDYRQAASLYQTAADLGNADAQFKLGQMHERGQGVPKNPRLADYWYRIAANQGHQGAIRKVDPIGLWLKSFLD